ncbi:uncharacterized protein LOC143363448 [Halictus rubicundus]|uniref:uncharacterized protein LOC143363448 n=1 Tax=Halictus rubicundus TaxID=77578 RepID=UPI004036AFE0
MAGRKRKIPSAEPSTDAPRKKQTRATAMEEPSQEREPPNDDQPGPSRMVGVSETTPSRMGIVEEEEDHNPDEDIELHAGAHSTPQQESSEGILHTLRIGDAAAHLAQAIANTLKSVREASMGEGNSRFVNRLTSAGKLPTFSGDPLEWIHFKESYRLTELGAYSDRENMARLFTALKGEARDAVSTLLATSQDADTVMRALELNFGNKNVVARKIINDIKGLPHLDAGSVNIAQFATKLRNAVVAFRSLKLTGYLHSLELIQNVGSKLPSALKYAYNRYSVESLSEKSQLEKLSDFLYKEAELAVEAGVFNMDTNLASSSRTTPASRQRVTFKGRKFSDKGVFAINTVESREQDVEKCVFCNRSNHGSEHCREFARETIARRWHLVKRHRLCFKCLRKGHPRDKCRGVNCSTCKGRHNSLLHNFKFGNENSKAKQSSGKGSGNRERNAPDASAESGNPPSRPWLEVRCSLLKILPVRIWGPRRDVETYALLDEGSTITLIDQTLSREIGARGTRSNMFLKGLLTHEKLISNCERVQFGIQGDGGRYEIKQAITIRDLNLPTQSISDETANHVEIMTKIKLKSYLNAPPRILIGQDNWPLIVTRELREIKNADYVLSRCLLGWTLHGNTKSHSKRKELLSSHVTWQKSHENVLDDPESLDELVRKYFCVDTLGIDYLNKNENKQNRAVKILQEACHRKGNFWEIGLLWKDNRARNVNSKGSALKRLISLERKLDRDAEYAALYYAEVDRFIEKGYAVKIRDDEIGENSWYLPHFGVQNINKPGRIRLVFDAAAKSKGISLNDQLDPGPDLLKFLPGILLRFRLHRFAFKADIKDMFLQIRIKKEDQIAQKFLWRGRDRVKSPETYAMTRLIFGSKSSPCCAIYVKNKNAEEYGESKPDAAKSIIDDSYMDDYLASRKTIKETTELIRDVIQINLDGGFEMHGWASNSKKILTTVAEGRRPKGQNEMRLGDQGGERVLGLIWDTETDELRFNLGIRKIPETILTGKVKPTKREFLRIIMSIFDPLGFLSPFTLKSKILMQAIWRSDVGWDQEIRDEEHRVWMSWLKGLREIKIFRIPRCYAPDEIKYLKIQLHVFCDASLKGCAAAAYLRFIGKDERIWVSFVMARTRVAPLKPMTVPRLELQAAVIGARLAKMVAKELGSELDRRFLWSDSSTVIHWIRSEPRNRQTFVANRLGEIVELTLSSEWRWVPSGLNPADDATRWLNESLNTNDRWFSGPGFLQQPESKWPVEKIMSEVDKREIDNIELRKTQVYVVQSSEYHIPSVARFLGWPGLLVAARRVKKAFDRWRGKQQTPITVETIYSVEMYWYRTIQGEVFAREIEALNTGKGINKGSKIIGLKPFMDEVGILRARGRITKFRDGVFNNQPIILDSRHPATMLLIRAYHQRFFHGSSNTVVNEIRQKYYIVGVRRALRSLISKCLICRFRRAKPRSPEMSNLPPGRVAYRQRPFSHCGMDYFGPMQVKIGRRREKRWGVLFTCLTTRAVHLELADSLTTSSAIMALQRLAARRGSPLVVYSDNGTNFKGASKELRDAAATIDEENLRSYALEKRMKWIFNPPDAPHMGGVWERLIRSVKSALQAILRDQIPSSEVLHTLLVEIEHSVNSRPLTHISVDPGDEETLTPNHFLLGTSSGEVHLGRYDAQATCPKKQWKIAQSFAESFWRRWLREYLPTLISRPKWHKSDTNLKKGDLVLIVDFQMPRNSWNTGTIEEVYPGADGVIRIAKVRTAKGELIRPTRKLITLTSDTDDKHH